MKKILAKVLAVILTGITVFSAMPTLTYADEEQLTEELTAEEDSGIVYDAPGMEELDFSQARLIVIGSDGAFADSSISSYNSVSLYQFETVADAKLAYRYFYTYASYVTVDTQITIAGDDEIYPDESDVMTEDDNPLDRITEEAGAGAGYDIALIDTGASATDAASGSVSGTTTSSVNSRPASPSNTGTYLSSASRFKVISIPIAPHKMIWISI
mgnify:CR=1 FL=1